jgi:hypothetical protein
MSLIEEMQKRLAQMGVQPNALRDARQYIEWFRERNIRREDDACQEHHAAMKLNGRPSWASPTPVTVYVNQGRWCGDCPHCKGGVAVVPGWARAWCFTCGALFTDIVQPDPETRAKIETLLSKRPDPDTRNWQPWEKPIGLDGENVVHGVTKTLTYPRK